MAKRKCSACAYVECHVDEVEGSWYYCGSKDEDLGLTIIDRPACANFIPTTPYYEAVSVRAAGRK